MLSSEALTVRGYQISARLAYVLLAVVGVLSIAVIYTIDPRNPGAYPICPFLGLTGYHCPGCGTLRALHQLSHGQLFGALGYNPFTIVSLPFIIFSYVSGFAKAFRLPVLPAVFIPHQWIWALLVGVVAFWVLRNVPIDPLTVLAP
jgi:hypothetical protein